MLKIVLSPSAASAASKIAIPARISGLSTTPPRKREGPETTTLCGSQSTNLAPRPTSLPKYYRGTTPVETPKTPEEGYHFTEDMTDKAMRNRAMGYLHNRKYQEELDAWLRQIRDEAFVDIK